MYSVPEYIFMKHFKCKMSNETNTNTTWAKCHQ